MLPIDMLSSEAEAIFLEHGHRTEALTAVLRLDMTPEGEEGETFLALLAESEALLRIVPAENRIDTYSLADYRRPYVDSFLSTCRLLASYSSPEGEEYTVGIGYATNACKSRLFIFISVLAAVARGRTLTGDEPMFDPLRKKDEKKTSDTRGMLRRTAAIFLPRRSVALFTLFFLLIEIRLFFQQSRHFL